MMFVACNASRVSRKHAHGVIVSFRSWFSTLPLYSCPVICHGDSAKYVVSLKILRVSQAHLCDSNLVYNRLLELADLREYTTYI
jgi:hypothetical protein